MEKTDKQNPQLGLIDGLGFSFVLLEQICFVLPLIRFCASDLLATYGAI